MEIPVSIPLDASGFLRRECPTCEREFKWFSGEVDGRPDDFLDPHNYFCPYCGTPAGHDSWWTPAQLEYVQAAAMGPIQQHMSKEVRKHFGRGAKFTPASTEVPDLLVDPDDMVMIEPPCHPFEPLKIAEGWSEPLHCLVCGDKFRA